MSKHNQAAFMTGIKRMEIHDIPMPEAKADEVVIKVASVGLCGSDVHFFASGQRKGKDFALPFVLGHECSGYVVEMGPGVEGLQTGDRVAFEPQITCGRCDHCRSGRYNLCPGATFPSVPPHDGMLRRYAAIPAHLAYRLPDILGMTEGALIEPLAVGLSAAQRGGVTFGSTVTILGVGCIGLTVLLAARALGAGKILVSDLQDARGEKALELGADVFVNAAEGDVAAGVLDMTGGEGADIVFETAGSRVTAAQTVLLMRRGGVIVMVGNVNGETPFPFLDLMYKEGEIRTNFRYRNNFRAAMELAVSADVGRLASHRFSFAEAEAAFFCALENQSEIIKAVISLDD